MTKIAENTRPEFQEDMLEIIFAHRNKAYGAYQLRRSYDRNLAYALGGAIVIIALLAFLPRILKEAGSLVISPNIIETTVTLTPKKEQPIPEKEKFTPPLQEVKQAAGPTRPTIRFTPPIIVSNEAAPDDPNQMNMNQLDSMNIQVGKSTSAGDPTGDPGDFKDPDPGVFGTPEKPIDMDETFSPIDIQKLPAFPGGEAAMMEYLRNEIVYPAIARENNIQGTVALSFIIGKDGNISDIKIIKEPGGGCGQEAVRVVQSMPNWTPGEANGNPVKVRFTLPVRFRLQ